MGSKVHALIFHALEHRQPLACVRRRQRGQQRRGLLKQRVEALAWAAHIAVDHHHKVGGHGGLEPRLHTHANRDKEVKVLALQAAADGGRAGVQLGSGWAAAAVCCGAAGPTWIASFSK